MADRQDEGQAGYDGPADKNAGAENVNFHDSGAVADESYYLNAFDQGPPPEWAEIPPADEYAAPQDSGEPVYYPGYGDDNQSSGAIVDPQVEPQVDPQASINEEAVLVIPILVGVTLAR